MSVVGLVIIYLCGNTGTIFTDCFRYEKFKLYYITIDCGKCSQGKIQKLDDIIYNN